MMAKTLAFERSMTVDTEQVTLKLFKVSRGYSLERCIIEKDDAASVQVLLINGLDEFDVFASADPYNSVIAPFYYEIRRKLTDDGLNE
jgi:hypothetical protein